MRSHCRAVLALLTLLAGGVVLDATVVVPMDLRELVSQASVIVYGRVTDVRGRVAGQRTESIVTLGAPFFLKGSGGREVQFRLPGGRIGRYRTVVPGTPELQSGDEVVVFLADEAPVGVPLGFSQGVLKVSRASAGAVPMVLGPPVSRDARAERVVRGSEAARFVALSSFVEHVRALMATPPEPRIASPRRSAEPGKTGGW
jgi:hypothetical protein